MLLKKRSPFKILDDVVYDVTDFDSWKKSTSEAKYCVFEYMQGEVYKTIIRKEWIKTIKEKELKGQFYNMVIVFENISREIGFDYDLSVFRSDNSAEIIIYHELGSIKITGNLSDVVMRASCIAWIYFELFDY